MNAQRWLVVLDVDGTLIDSQDHIHAAMVSAFAAVGRTPPARAQVLGIVGLSLPEAVATLAPELDPEARAAIVAAYRSGFAAARGATPAPLYPGAAEALRALAARTGVILGVATGKSRRGLDRLIADHGMQGLFATRQVADDHPSKPHPSMLLAALAETGVPASRAVMVGDTSFDMEMGRRAGVTAIGVAWGYHPRAALAAGGADQIVDGFADLVPALETIWGRT
ncbi:MAG: HAD-IA family hydrolase [Proteobacteria bacterium]|nr:HAD-IA family hydrolase [Pseudomonadota bacterium]MBS0574652.1 HAD-IA family hydrolase [Pseudomonadota bacterium]